MPVSSLPSGGRRREATGVGFANEEAVVLRGLIEHAAAAVRDVPDEGVAALPRSLLWPLGRCRRKGWKRSRPGDHVEVAVAVEIVQRRDVGVEADQRHCWTPHQSSSCRRGWWSGRWGRPPGRLASRQSTVGFRSGCCGTHPARRRNWHREAGPILHALREGGAPIGPVQIGQWGFRYIRRGILERGGRVLHSGQRQRGIKRHRHRGPLQRIAGPWKPQPTGCRAAFQPPRRLSAYPNVRTCEGPAPKPGQH